jgi:hypothetical protein
MFYAALVVLAVAINRGQAAASKVKEQLKSARHHVPVIEYADRRPFRLGTNPAINGS